MVLQCELCLKWQVIYSKTVISFSERNELEKLIENLTYSCGSVFQNIEQVSSSLLLTKVYVKGNLICNTPVEIPYYSAKNADICYHCGGETDLIVKEGFYPTCQLCQGQGKKMVPCRTRKNYGPK